MATSANKKMRSAAQSSAARRRKRHAQIPPGKGRSAKSEMDKKLTHLASFPELNPNPVVEVDLAGHLHYLNPATKRLFPDLQAKGLQHPWLRDLAEIAKMFEQQGGTYHTRELKIGDLWYQQTISPVSKEKRLRIFGLDVTAHKQAEEALRESAERYRGLYDAIAGGLLEVDRRGTILEANAAARETLGLTEDQIRACTLGDLRRQAINEDGSPLPIEGHPSMRAVSTGIPVNGQVMGVFNPVLKQTRWLLVNAESILDPKTSRVQSAVSTFVDITDLKKKEEELYRLNRTLTALSNSSKAMMRATDEAAYMNEVCRIAVEDCGHKMVWIGFAQKDEAKSVLPVASAGFEQGYLEALRITWADTERGRGPTGTAIRTGQVSMCRNMLTDPNFAPWREQAIKRGYASSIVLPLMAEGLTFGAINIYSKDPDPFSENEVNLLVELADDLAHGITTLRLRAAHDQAEAAIIRAKEEWERTFDAVPDLIAILDDQHRVLRVNRAMAERLGMSTQECIGKACYEAVHGLTCPPEICPHVGTLADGQEHIAELHEDRLDGDFLVSTTPLVDEQGRRIGSVHVARDITERKRIEQSLRESEERFRMIASSTPDHLLKQDRELRYSYVVNPQLGLTEQDMIGKTDYDFLNKEDADKLTTIKRHVLDTGEAVSLESSLVDNTGELQYFEGSYVPTFDEKRETTGLIGYFKNITARKRGEEAVRENKERFELLSETASRLLNTDKPQEIVNELCRKVMVHLDCHAFFNYLVDAEKERLHLNTYAGISEDEGRKIEWLDYGVAVCGCAARDAARIVCENIPESPDIRTALVKSYGIKAYACHPLFSGGLVIGTLSFGTRTRGTFTEDELMLMKTVADQVAVAMERRRLLDRISQSRDELEARVLERTQELMNVVAALQDEMADRRQAEETAKAERQRFNDVLETLPAYVCLLTPDYRMPFANKVFRDRFGYSSDKKCYEFLFGRSEPCEVCETYAVLKTKTPQGWEWTGPDNRTYDVFDFPFTDTDGSPLILEMGIDITERKQAEEALRVASVYARSLLEASLDPLVTIDAEGKVTDVNKATEEVTGVSRDWLLGSDFSDYFTDPDKARAVYQKVFLEGSVRDYPLTIRDTKGHVTEVLYNATVYKNETGELQGVFAAARDITAQKTAEWERLRLSAAVEQSGESIVITDDAGEILYVNPAFGRINDYPPSEVSGKNYFDILFGNGPGRGFKKKLADILGKGHIWKDYLTRKKRDDTFSELDVSISPVRDHSGRIINYSIIERDVTREAALEQHLHQQQKMEALGTLAGGIAHDFNNILMPIIINTELSLYDMPEASPIRAYLSTVLQAAQRGQELVKQIISFSRQKEMELSPISITPVIKETLKFLRSTVPPHIEIRETFEAESGMMMADPTQIHQVVMNLCNNAVHAMREKGGVLEVSLTAVEVDADMLAKHLDLKPGNYLKLAVTDTGSGMDEELVKRIFDPFFTTKKPGEGTGMGLAVVHGIVKRHEGGIVTYSEPGKGTTFNLFFPRIQGIQRQETAEIEAIPMGEERILFVDDEEVQCQSGRHLLERLGYTVVTATDGLAALDLFRAQPSAFGLVITDQNMPRLTGIELAEKMLQIRPEIPVILCTGFSEVVDGKEAKARGIQEFMMKPFSVQQLAETIRCVLGKKD